MNCYSQGGQGRMQADSRTGYPGPGGGRGLSSRDGGRPEPEQPEELTTSVNRH